MRRRSFIHSAAGVGTLVVGGCQGKGVEKAVVDDAEARLRTIKASPEHGTARIEAILDETLPGLRDARRQDGTYVFNQEQGEAAIQRLQAYRQARIDLGSALDELEVRLSEAVMAAGGGS